MNDDLIEDVIKELIRRNPDSLGSDNEQITFIDVKPQDTLGLGTKVIEISDGEEDDYKHHKVVYTTEAYPEKSKRTYKPSWYFLSPYDKEIEETRVDE
ncbi:hypothetical protein LIER_12176 [Lithospermum erythrorhizon]|uniref:Uncharacterized protein n=1 Tax=Lithospermum erythrorhizon TaxID=34254 RepID=A0AAV3PS82_LITER